MSALVRFARGDVEDGLQFAFLESRPNGETLTRINERVQSDGGNAEVCKKIQRVWYGVHVRAQHRGVGHHVKSGLQGVLQTLNGLFERAFGAHHLVVDLFIARLDRDLHMIEPGVHELLHVPFIRKAARVRVEPGDLPVRFGLTDQFRQVVSQRRFAAGEDDVRNAQRPELIQNLEPSLGIEFGEVSFAGVVAVRTVVVAAISDRQIHAVGRGGTRAERHVHFQFKVVDRARAVGTDQIGKLKVESGKILSQLLTFHFPLSSHDFYGFRIASPFKDHPRHERGCRIQVHDAVGVDDERAAPIRVEPQVDARFLVFALAGVMVKPRSGLQSLPTLECLLKWHSQETLCSGFQRIKIQGHHPPHLNL